MRALFLAVLGALLLFAAPAGAITPHAVAALSCSAKDSTTSISAQANASSGKTLTLPAKGCFTVDGTVSIHNVTNEVINGNGATLVSPARPDGGKDPILDLLEDTNLTIENLNIVGGYTGSNGGPGEEGNYGVRFEGDNGVTLWKDNVSNVQGDALFLSPPYDLKDTDALNTGIGVYFSHFTNVGYHGITNESTGCPTAVACKGFTVDYDTFTNVATDAMDFEYDRYSTGFNTNGTPFFAAQDYVTIENSTWTNWGADWFASIQGQTPGVQQQRVTITGNTLEGNGALFEVVGTPTFSTSPPYLNAYMTITNNKMAPGGYGAPYRGDLSVTAEISGVAGLIMEHNTFPLCDGLYEYPQPVSQCGVPNEDELDLYNISYSVIADNDFSGALRIVLPRDYRVWNTYLYLCGNKYGAGGSQTDATCEAFVSR